MLQDLESETFGGYLIYHRADLRYKSTFSGGRVVYHDKIRKGNQDPYIWNKTFFHTFCHITQLSPVIEHINLWVAEKTFSNFDHLYCDLVFTVARRCYWDNAQELTVEEGEKLGISPESAAWGDHFKWTCEHPFKKRRRYTLQAHPDLSFQPQMKDGGLVDILGMLERHGCSRDQLRKGLKGGFNSKPMKLPVDVVKGIRSELKEPDYQQVYGEELAGLRRKFSSNFGQNQSPVF